MSRHDGGKNTAAKAVALHYGDSDNAPVVVASGMGYMAEKIVETAQEHGVPIYEDNSLATILAQLKLGQEIPEELYRAIVEIYVYFLKFDPNKKESQPADESSSASNGIPEEALEEVQDTAEQEDTAAE